MRFPRLSIARRGVTLLEVLMVLIVMSAAIALAGVSPTFYDNAGLRQEAELVTSTFRVARETALMTRCQVSLRHDRVKDPATNNFRDRLQLIATPGPYSDSQMRFGGQPATGSNWMTDPIWLDEKVTLKTDRREFRFEPSGIADRDVQWKLVSGDESIEISVQAADGRIVLGSP